MKRILAIGLAVLLMMGLAGCSEKKEETTAKPSDVVQTKPETDADKPQDEEKQEQSGEGQQQTDQKQPQTQQSGSSTAPIPQLPNQQGTNKPETNEGGASGTEDGVIQQSKPIGKRNTELEQALVGKWSTTLDYGTVLGVETGIYTCTQYHTFEKGKLTISFNEEEMRSVLKSVMRAVYQKAADEANTTLEGLGITEEALNITVNASVTSAKEMMVAVDYAVYGEDLWYSGLQQGTLVSVEENRIVIEASEAAGGADTIVLKRVG